MNSGEQRSQREKSHAIFELCGLLVFSLNITQWQKFLCYQNFNYLKYILCVIFLCSLLKCALMLLSQYDLDLVFFQDVKQQYGYEHFG